MKTIWIRECNRGYKTNAANVGLLCCPQNLHCERSDSNPVCKWSSWEANKERCQKEGLCFPDILVSLHELELKHESCWYWLAALNIIFLLKIIQELCFVSCFKLWLSVYSVNRIYQYYRYMLNTFTVNSTKENMGRPFLIFICRGLCINAETRLTNNTFILFSGTSQDLFICVSIYCFTKLF